MGGDPGTYTAGTPEDVKGLRKNLIALINNGMSAGATPYGGPMGTTADAGQLQAMNMLMRMSGGGAYTAPGMYSLPNQPNMSSSSRVQTGGNNGTGPGSPVPGNPGAKIIKTPDIPGPIDDGGINRPMSGVNTNSIASILRLMQSRGMR
jgi:hypothetical protein